MDLTKEEYERIIELQAVALSCAERSLATLREEHERLKKDLKEKREFTMDCLAKEVAHAKAQNELKKALEEERKLTRDLREEHEELKKDLEEECKLSQNLRAMYVAAIKNCTCDCHKEAQHE